MKRAWGPVRYVAALAVVLSGVFPTIYFTSTGETLSPSNGWVLIVPAAAIGLGIIYLFMRRRKAPKLSGDSAEHPE
jgi:hypothetical protein